MQHRGVLVLVLVLGCGTITPYAASSDDAGLEAAAGAGPTAGAGGATGAAGAATGGAGPDAGIDAAAGTGIGNHPWGGGPGAGGAAGAANAPGIAGAGAGGAAGGDQTGTLPCSQAVPCPWGAFCQSVGTCRCVDATMGICGGACVELENGSCP